MAMTLNSPAFQPNGHIPSKYTCEGEDVSPPLAWEGAPKGAKSLVLIRRSEDMNGGPAVWPGLPCGVVRVITLRRARDFSFRQRPLLLHLFRT